MMNLRLVRQYTAASLGLVLLSASVGAQSTPAPPAGVQSTPAEPPALETAFGENYHVEFAAGLWATMPSTVQYSDTENSLAGTDIDFKQQLGLHNQQFAEFHLVVQPIPKHKLRAEYIPLNYQQAATLKTNLTFNGQSYLAGQAVSSTLRWNAWRAAYEYDVLTSDRGFVGGTIGVDVVDVSGTLGNGVQSGTAGVQIPMPALGAIGRYYPSPRFSVTGEFTGFYLPGGSTSTHGHGIKVDGYATVHVSKYVGIQGGYRVFDVNYAFKTSSPNTGLLTIAGPYVGGTIHR
jgi:hypothetical protein